MPRPRRFRIPRFLPALAVLLALTPWRLPPPARAAAPAMVVAVLYFDNNTGDRAYDVLQKGLADMLVTDLAGVSSLQVVEREKLEKIIGELDLQRSKYFDPKTAQKLGQVIGARYAVTGAFSAIEPKMRIDIRLIDVTTAAVLMADKVVGKKDAFFELEAQLVAKFVRGLDVRTKIEADSGVRDVATLLAYSEGIDLADKGDLEQASQKLGTLVRSAPRFTLAQKKYTDVMRRLALAKKRRAAGLDENEKLLLASIERALGQKLSTLDQAGALRYLGYRVARGNYHLWQARKLTGLGPNEQGPVWVPEADRPELRRHLTAFFANTMTLIAEIEALHKRFGASAHFDTTIDEDDRRRGNELGIADDIHEWTFATPDRVARPLAEFAVLGITPFWLNIKRFSARPSLAELDPAYAKKAFALIEDARRAVRASKQGDELQTAMAEITDTHAEALLRLGRREEAIAQWQSFLDQYPKAPEYQGFEAKVEALLGVSAAAQAFEAALATCSNEVFGLVYHEVERMGRAEGSAGLRRLVDAVEQCNRGPAGPSLAVQVYFFAGRDGAMRGDCALYRDMRARAAKLGAAFTVNFDMPDAASAHCR
jgi:TolB-like protein/tetratricopeptide (TPR) repeat protein